MVACKGFLVPHVATRIYVCVDVYTIFNTIYRHKQHIHLKYFIDKFPIIIIAV